MHHVRQSWLPRQELLELASTESGHLSLIDSLTHAESGLYNQDFLSYKLYEETRRATRFGDPLSCLLLALTMEPQRDGLMRIARILRNGSRDTDFPCHLDGRSFLVLMPRTDLVGAEAAGVRILDQLDRLPLSERPLDNGGFGIGVASAGPGVLMRGGELYDLACDALSLALASEGRPLASCTKSSAGVAGRSRRVIPGNAATA